MLGNLRSRPLVRALLGNSIWILADKGLRVVVGLFVTSQMARHLGAETFGTIHYALSVVYLFSIFGSLGLENLLNRDISRQSSSIKSDLLGTAFWLRLGFGVLGVLLIFGLFAVKKDPLLPEIMVAAVSLLFLSFDVSEVFFHSQVRSDVVVRIRSLSFLLSSGVRLYLVSINASAWAFLWVATLEMALGSLFIFWFFRKETQYKYSLKFNPTIAWQLIQQSGPLLVFALSASALIRLDSILIEKYLGTAALGNYSVAVKLTEIFYIIPMALVGSSLPALSRSFKDDPKTFRKRGNELFFVLGLMGGILALGLAGFSEHLTALLFGPQYQEGAQVLKVYAFCLIFVYLGAVRNTLWLAQGKLTLMAFSMLCGPVSIVVGFFFIKEITLEKITVLFLIGNFVSYFATSVFDPKMFFQQLPSGRSSNFDNSD